MWNRTIARDESLGCLPLEARSALRQQDGGPGWGSPPHPAPCKKPAPVLQRS